MNQYETKVLEALKQIAEDVRWLRTNAEAAESARAEADRQLQEQIEKGHSFPTDYSFP